MNTTQLSFPGMAPAYQPPEPRSAEGRAAIWAVRLGAVCRSLHYCASQIWAPPLPFEFRVFRDDFHLLGLQELRWDFKGKASYASLFQAYPSRSFRDGVFSIVWSEMWKRSREPESFYFHKEGDSCLRWHDLKALSRAIGVKEAALRRFIADARSEEILALYELELLTPGAP